MMQIWHSTTLLVPLTLEYGRWLDKFNNFTILCSVLRTEGQVHEVIGPLRY